MLVILALPVGVLAFNALCSAFGDFDRAATVMRTRAALLAALGWGVLASVVR